MREIAVKIYSYSELSPKAKDKARNWWRDAATGDEWWDSTIEDFLQILNFLGFDTEYTEVKFSGFSCQGDGASFVGTWRAAEVESGEVKKHAPIDEPLQKLATTIESLAAKFPAAVGKLKRISTQYAHENTVGYDYPDDSYESADLDDDSTLWNRSMVKNFEETCQALMRWVYRQLEKEHDHYFSEENIAESMEENEYTFLDDGTRFEEPAD